MCLHKTRVSSFQLIKTPMMITSSSVLIGCYDTVTSLSCIHASDNIEIVIDKLEMSSYTHYYTQFCFLYIDTYRIESEAIGSIQFSYPRATYLLKHKYSQEVNK